MNQFLPSPWIMLANHSREKVSRKEILETLHRLYSKPIYPFVAREYPKADPADVTQEVFVRLLRTKEIDRTHELEPRDVLIRAA